MSRYRGLKSLRKYELQSGYKSGKTDPYRILELYRRLYVNPRQPTSSGKYKSQRRKRRSGGGYGSRLRNFKWPQEYQRQSSGPKYERKPKQSMSSPPKRQPVQYIRFGFKPEQNTEQMLKELEKKLDNKLSERLLERLEVEFEELQRKIDLEKAETGSENSAEIAFKGDMTEENVEASRSESVELDRAETTYKSTETTRDAEEEKSEQLEKFETGEREMGSNGEHLVEVEVNDDYDQKEDEKTAEELTEHSTSLEGGFVISHTLGSAIPLEVDESQDAEVHDESIENEPGVESESVESVEAEPPTEADVKSEAALEPMLYEIEPEPLDAETN